MAIGTFGTFTQARLGIYAATKGLTVTGNNISNINTVGYTRQALDQVSLRNGGADRYQGKYDLRVGNGALIKSISQLRDPYLDIRYRSETSIVGHNEQQLKGLTSIADIIDEVGKGANKGDGIVFAQFSHFLSSLQQLNTDAAAQSNDTLTRASADTLTNLFHFYADKLERLQSDTADQLRQEVAGLNGVLAGIRDLNSAIRKSEIHGDPGLEMRDERNRLIDKLAEYVKIDVVYTMEDVGAGQQVEKLTISLGNANPDPKIKTDSTVLVDGIYARQFEMPESFPVENADYDPKYKADPDKPNPDNDIKQYKYLKADGTGTNVAADAEQIPNSNFDMTLTKLLDSKGREWSNIISSSTSKLDAGAPALKDAPMKAVYAYEITSQKDQWAVGDEITIAGTTYVAGASKDGKPGIPLNTLSDSDRLAAFIAAKLDANPNSEYDVTADGNKIIFTAKNAGAVGALKGEDGNPIKNEDGSDAMGSGPSTAPSLVLADAGTKVTLTPAAADLKATQEGKEGDPTKFPPSPVATNSDGTTSLTTYAMRGSTWYETKINVEYSQEVPLDDNDLYGAIQAFREILTEAGEFSTADTVSNVDENAAIKRGIPYYQKSLDLLARVFANAFNEANNGFAVDQDGNYLDEDGEVLTDASGNALNKNTGLTADQKGEALKNFVKTYDVKGVNANGNLVNGEGEEILMNGKPVAATQLTQEELGAANPVNEYLAGATINEDGVILNADGDPIKLPDGTELKIGLTQEQEQTVAEDWLVSLGADKMGGNLFSCRGDLDDGEGITASNISVSRSWANGDVHIVNTFTKLFGGDIENTTQDNNIGHMVSLMSKGLVYDPSSLVDGAESTHLFQGSFQDMLINMCSVLGNDQTEVQTNLITAATYQVEMDTNRDSVSAVDLNDEAMNMMTYAKSLNAAYRLMTTLDEALERLINNTGVVGR